MRENEASLTALRVAQQRAAHQLFDKTLVFADSLAAHILGEEEKLHSAAADYRTPFALAFRSAVVARSRYCQDSMAAALTRSLGQVVILGAGLDTTAYRGVLPGDVKVYEVDHPATQAWKKARLRAAGIAIPPSTAFIPIDFDKTTLLDGLRSGLVDLAQPTFFSWLGVTYYLPAKTVIATLAAIGSLAAGGEIVFDYFEPPQNYRLEERPGLDSFGKEAVAAGEPWKSFFEPAAMAAKLGACGFAPIEDSDSDAMAARYFAGRADGLIPTGPMRFVRARIGPGR